MRKTFVLAFALFVSLTAVAQKELKQVKANLKSGKNLDQTEKLVNDFMAKDDNKNNPKYHQLAGDIQKKINAVENEKLYLKQKYDTARYFNSMRKMFECYERCDSLERDSTLNPQQKFKYRKRNYETLKTYRQNLPGGGSYYLAKNNPAEAYNIFSTFLNTAYQPMFKVDNFKYSDRRMARAAYWTVYCGHIMKDPDKTLKYSDIALLDTTRSRMRVMEYMADAYHEKKDTAQWVGILEMGVFRYPQNPYFFVHLMDYFNASKRYQEGLAYANRMLAADSVNIIYRYSRVLTLMNLKKYKECIDECNAIIAVDSNYVDAYYNAGVAHCNEAVEIENNACINVNLPQFKIDHDRIRLCYTKALPYMEKVRALSPNDKQKWAPMLYRIYLNLNMGKEFGEIEKILNQPVK